MIFVGRKKEKGKIIDALQHGKNIIVTGKFGIGRTSLMQEVAKEMNKRRQFLFVDFSQTPGKMSDTLMKEMGISRRFHKSGTKMGYKSMCHRIAKYASPAKNKTVIVFDNIARLTPQRNIFLRRIIEESHFQFIAICENFLPAKEFMRLRAQLIPMETIALNHLPTEDVSEFIRQYTIKLQLDWSDAYIDDVTALAGGYPLGIIDLIKSVMNK